MVGPPEHGVWKARPNHVPLAPKGGSMRLRPALSWPRWEVDFVKNDACWDPDCGPEQPTVPGRIL